MAAHHNPQFPTKIEDFGSDDRISFSRLDGKYVAVHDDGTEFEFDVELQKWIPTDDEPLDLRDSRTELAGAESDDSRRGGYSSRKRKDAPSNGNEVSLFPPTCLNSFIERLVQS
jgi:HIV Tat-specific factor 1